MTIFTRIILANEFRQGLFGGMIGCSIASSGMAGLLSYGDGLETKDILKNTIYFGFFGAGSFITSPIWIPCMIYDIVKKRKK